MIGVISPGLLTTVQDGGRRGMQSSGVPVCGAMDNYSLRLANALVDNSPEEAALELTALGPTLKLERDCVFALCGGDFDMRLDGVKLHRGRAYHAKAGALLEIGAAKRGLRGYLAFGGGFDLPLVLGSRSTYIRGGFGGFEGRRLKAGDRLGLRGHVTWLPFEERRVFGSDILDYPLRERPVRVVAGPQDEMFSAEGLETFLSSEYSISADSDRMGCRLEGPLVSFAEGFNGNIISDGVAMGSVQVPSGRPIVMMADRQTTGGYAKIATVITADLPLIAQKKAGDKVRFEAISGHKAAQTLKRLRKAAENVDFLYDFW